MQKDTSCPRLARTKGLVDFEIGEAQ